MCVSVLDLATCSFCNMFFSLTPNQNKSSHKRTDSNYSSNSSEFSQSLGSTEGEDSPVQTEVMYKVT